MKKYIFSAIALGIAFVGCQKEVVEENVEPQVEQQTISFVTKSDAETKTTMSISGSKVTYSWSAEDKDFHIFYGDTPANMVETTPNSDNGLTIKASFDADVLPKTGTAEFTGYLNGSVKNEQTMVSDSYDPSSDVLVAKASANMEGTAPATIYFSRKISVAKFTLNGLPGAPTSVEVSGDKPILGSWDKDGNYDSAEGSITVTGMTSNVVFLTCAPNTDITFTITAIGEDWVYKGTASNKTLTAGNVRGMKVAMTVCPTLIENFNSTNCITEASKKYGSTCAFSTESPNYKEGFNYTWFIPTTGESQSVNVFDGGIKLGASGKTPKSGAVANNSILSNISKGDFTIIIYASAWGPSSESNVTDDSYSELTVSYDGSSITKNTAYCIISPNDKVYSKKDFVHPISYTFTKGSSDEFIISVEKDVRVLIDKVVVFATDADNTPSPTPFTVNVADNIANGSVSASPTSAVAGMEITLVATPDEGYEFGSWNVTNASNSESIDVADNKFTMPSANVNVSATFNLILGGDDDYTHDVLTNADFAATSTTYKDFEKVKKNTAIYAGNSAKNNGIQLRSNNSNSGIVSTTSGGKIKTVTVKWNTNCASGRTIDVYGSNTAYTSAADLYNSTNQGTKLGSIVMGTSTSVTVTGDYAYVGVRSNNGALNIDDIDFAWSEGEGTTEYTITLTQVTGGKISAMVDGSSVNSGDKIEEGKTVTITATPASADYEFGTWSVNGATVGTSSTETFTINSDVTVSATFNKKQGGDGKSETYNFASFAQANDVTLNATNFTITLHKNTGSTAPQWNGNSSEARVYAKGSVEVTSEKNITKVVYNYTANAGGKNNVTPTIDSVVGSTDAGTWDVETNTWKGSDKTVTLTTSGAAGNLGFKSITVYYE